MFAQNRPKNHIGEHGVDREAGAFILDELPNRFLHLHFACHVVDRYTVSFVQWWCPGEFQCSFVPTRGIDMELSVWISKGSCYGRGSVDESRD
jgi:hypothetical protein